MKTVKVFTDSKAFEIAADKTRRRIIHLLRARVLSVSQIADEHEMTPQAIYHHIRKMLEVGLVEMLLKKNGLNISMVPSNTQPAFR